MCSVFFGATPLVLFIGLFVCMCVRACACVCQTHTCTQTCVRICNVTHDAPLLFDENITKVEFLSEMSAIEHPFMKYVSTPRSFSNGEYDTMYKMN